MASQASRERPPVVVVTGPTASGKTPIAIELAQRFEGEIVNADSMQVYRYMDIGTAKPDAAQRAAVPHHLLDVVDPDASYSAGRYLREARAAAATRQQIAFYGSTPAYRKVLEVHGWEGLQPELNQLSKRGDWVRMGDLISDEVLETFAVVAPPDDVARQLVARYGDIIDRVSFYWLDAFDTSQWDAVMRELRDS